MLTLNEHIAIEEAISLFEGEAPAFTDEQIDKAEYFSMKWNPVTDGTELYIYDDNGETLGSVSFSDPEVAIAVAQDMFDFDEDDVYDMESYAWAEDPEDREWETLQDDGTSGV